jgi:uncharacterized membrane protein
MTRWVVPFLVFLATAVGAWHATIAVTTFGLMEGAVRRLSARAGLNMMSYGTLANPANQPIVRPSPDLAYSSCAYDLSNGPLLINYVPVEGRYSSLSVFDARTDVVFVRNDVQAGGKPFRIAVARDGQKVPDGIETVRVGYDRGIALVRLLLADPKEIAQFDSVRRQSNCATIKR